MFVDVVDIVIDVSFAFICVEKFETIEFYIYPNLFNDRKSTIPQLNFASNIDDLSTILYIYAVVTNRLSRDLQCQ